jgi:hypothetical protein
MLYNSVVYSEDMVQSLLNMAIAALVAEFCLKFYHSKFHPVDRRCSASTLATSVLIGLGFFIFESLQLESVPPRNFFMRMLFLPMLQCNFGFAAQECLNNSSGSLMILFTVYEVLSLLARHTAVTASPQCRHSLAYYEQHTDCIDAEALSVWTFLTVRHTVASS